MISLYKSLKGRLFRVKVNLKLTILERLGFYTKKASITTLGCYSFAI